MVAPHSKELRSTVDAESWRPSVLWADLRTTRDHASFCDGFAEYWEIHRATTAQEVDREIQLAYAIDLICFEYDYPDIPALSVLQQTMERYKDAPVIMLTEQHSEALAVWAFRTRVWDYLVKPVKVKELITSVDPVLHPGKTISETNHLPGRAGFHPIPNDQRFQNRSKKWTLIAENYIKTHYQQKIREKDIARLCDMSVSSFSRAFKKEHNTTFRDYLISYRIHKARELLLKPKATITDVAYTVGFNDLSYFSRVFRRFTGQAPSTYIRECK